MTHEPLPLRSRRTSPASRDFSAAVMAAFAVVLCLLVTLPIGWIIVFAFTDRDRSFTLANFHTLFTDPVFVEPLLTTFIIAASVSLACCLFAAPLGWLVARTDILLRRSIRVIMKAYFDTTPY